MKAFTFRCEANWVLLLVVGVPAIGILVAIVWPAIARWLAAR